MELIEIKNHGHATKLYVLGIDISEACTKGRRSL